VEGLVGRNVLDIDKLLGKQKISRIYLVGIELEGGWEKLPEGASGPPQRDGSVHVQAKRQSGRNTPWPLPSLEAVQNAMGRTVYIAQYDTHGSGEVYVYDRRSMQIVGNWYMDFAPAAERQMYEATRGRQPKLHVGEYVSDPMEVRKVPAWMKQYYPSHVNDTCGLHFHMRFRSALDYQRLMVPEYQDTVLAYLKKWAKDEGIKDDHTIWNRLSGKNEYCQAAFFPDEQAMRDRKIYDRSGVGHRYTAINYCWSLGNRKTIECRVLPMFDEAEQGIRAIQHVLAITNACLLALSTKRETEEVGELVITGDDTYRESRQQLI